MKCPAFIEKRPIAKLSLKIRQVNVSPVLNGDEHEKSTDGNLLRKRR